MPALPNENNDILEGKCIESSKNKLPTEVKSDDIVNCIKRLSMKIRKDGLILVSFISFKKKMNIFKAVEITGKH